MPRLIGDSTKCLEDYVDPEVPPARELPGAVCNPPQDPLDANLNVEPARYLDSSSPRPPGKYCPVPHGW